MQSWHTKPFVGPLPPWLWAILPMMILPAGFIKGFQPRRKCWKHQETSGKHRCVHMFWPSMFPDFRRKVILHDWLVMSHFSVYETIPARWKGKGDSSNEQFNELLGMIYDWVYHIRWFRWLTCWKFGWSKKRIGAREASTKYWYISLICDRA